MRRPILVLTVVCLAVGLVAGDAVSGARSDDPLEIAVSPQTLLLSATQSGRVVVHTAIPYRTVDLSSVALNGIPATRTGADDRGELVASFDEDVIKGIVAPPTTVLTLTGLLTTGEAFSGSDEVRVIP